ncbi:hypothetical protein B0H12DRAFT_223406 [Mycena haematopus]|nr:hypothetical protein B0H12DRAFT_223406 [Mycena haematopus]
MAPSRSPLQERTGQHREDPWAAPSPLPSRTGIPARESLQGFPLDTLSSSEVRIRLDARLPVHNWNNWNLWPPLRRDLGYQSSLSLLETPRCWRRHGMGGCGTSADSPDGNQGGQLFEDSLWFLAGHSAAPHPPPNPPHHRINKTLHVALARTLAYLPPPPSWEPPPVC